MSYPQFNLTTLQLPAPASNMTKAEYKTSYGIDLDEVNIKAFKLVLLGNEKYPIDQIKEVEGGYEIYFNGRILSITDIVHTSDEVYDVANAKLLYWHGLEMYNNANKSALLYAHIIKNNDSPISSLNNLIAWFYSFKGLVYLETSGYVTIDDEIYNVYSIYKRSEDVSPHLNLIAKKVGDSTYSALINFDLSRSVDTYHDGVNKLN